LQAKTNTFSSGLPSRAASIWAKICSFVMYGHLDGVEIALSGTGPAALAGGLDEVDGPGLHRPGELDRVEGADGHATPAHGALVEVDAGGDGLFLDGVAREQDARLGRRCQRLGHRLAHVLRVLHGASEIDPGRTGLRRAKLRVPLEEEAVFAMGDLELLGNILFNRFEADGEDERVGWDGQPLAAEGVIDRDEAVFEGDRLVRLGRGVVPEELGRPSRSASS